MRSGLFALICLSATLLSCHRDNGFSPALIPEKTIEDMKAYSGLSEKIRVDRREPRTSRQSYFFSADSISFGNYYNELLVYGYEEIPTSSDTIFRELSQPERIELVRLAKQLRTQAVAYAEYSYGWGCNVFRITRPDDRTRIAFLALSDTADVFIQPDIIRLLSAGKGFFCYIENPYP